MPRRQKSSSLPTVALVLAIAAAVGYFGYFRDHLSDANASTPAIEQAPDMPISDRTPIAILESPPPVSNPDITTTETEETSFSDVDALMTEDRWREARTAIAARFGREIPDAERRALAKRAVKINLRLLKERPDERDVDLYTIVQGDSLAVIANKFTNRHGVKGQIMLLNNYKETSILRVGRKVRVSRGTWSMAVDKSLFKLWLLYEGSPFKEYTIAIGTDRRTPAGEFTIGTRNPLPAWWPPAELEYKGKIPVPSGHPQNPLGAWWLAIDHDLHHGFGIHGTNSPESIGTKASNGCVRMLNKEVSEVAAVSFKGMKVAIWE